jgi:dolichyl-phosphate beta-glucosyltransferase
MRGADESGRERPGVSSKNRALSIVVPAFNEERRLPRLLASLDEQAEAACTAAGFELLEVVVVDDGSTDTTAELLRTTSVLRGRLHLLQLPVNQGKGAAVRAGVLAARGEFALLTDVDLSAPLEELTKLGRAVDGGADVAIGSRGLSTSTIVRRQPLYREQLGKMFNRILRLLTGLPYRDTQCGFKLFRLSTTRVLFERQRVRGFAFDAELCVLARAEGLSVVEVPVTWAHDPDTRVGLFRGSLQMGFDLARIAVTARRGRHSTTSGS